MVTSEEKRRDARLVQAAHRFREVEAGSHVAPVAVEQVARDNHEVYRLIDRTLHQVVEGRARGGADLVDGQALVSR